MFGLEIKYSLAKKSARNKMQSRFFYNSFFPFAFYSSFAIIYFVVLPMTNCDFPAGKLWQSS